MGKYSIELSFDEVPVSLNVLLRMHYMKRKRYNDHWYKQVINACNGKLPYYPLTLYKITIIRKTNRFLDYDGCVGSMKPLIDGLIKAEVIDDDSYKMSGPWNVTQEYRPKKEGQEIYIKVEDQGSKRIVVPKYILDEIKGENEQANTDNV